MRFRESSNRDEMKGYNYKIIIKPLMRIFRDVEKGVIPEKIRIRRFLNFTLHDMKTLTISY